MIKLATFLIILVLAVGCVAIVVNPSSIFRTSSSQRTFGEPIDPVDEFVGEVKSITIEREEHEFTTHFMDFANRYKPTPFKTGTFDRNGRKVEEFHYRTDGVPLPKATYSYNENGILLKTSHYSALTNEPHLEVICTYDSQGNLKEEINRSIEDGKVFGRKLYSHDFERNYTEIIDYDSDNVPQWKAGIFWNEQGKEREIFAYSRDGALFGTGTTTYNENGHIAEVVVWRFDGSPEQRAKYTYEFDARGNWIKRTLYYWETEEGVSSYKLMNIDHRRIVYYD
jgi:hypothetical protein